MVPIADKVTGEDVEKGEWLVYQDCQVPQLNALPHICIDRCVSGLVALSRGRRSVGGSSEACRGSC